MSRLLIAAVLLACSVVSAQDTKQFVLATNRAGVVELLDPVSLQTVSRIHSDFPPNSVGLNGASANADGSMIYVEGPMVDNPNGCCSLYSIDLATLRMDQAASIAGRGSGIEGMSNDRLHVSPDGHWLFGVRNFRGPALDMYDLVQGNIVRQLVPTGLEVIGLLVVLGLTTTSISMHQRTTARRHACGWFSPARLTSERE